MTSIKPPVKPFPNYKWRWASFQPTEGLNSPSVYFGVLRVYAAHDGESPSSPSVIADLARVQHETDTQIDLARTDERNLKRNAGQYWTALGLLEAKSGLHVTEFGQAVASGKITPSTFAATIVNSLTLPNSRIENNTDEWNNAGLSIKPLRLILEIIEDLSAVHGPESARMTPFELIHIVIPLAGARSQIREYTDAIMQYRQGRLSLDGWPNCTPKDNDERMAKEFLLFLANYGFCEVRSASHGDMKEYYLPAAIATTQALINLPATGDLFTIAEQVQTTDVLADIERQRVQVSVIARSQQSRFRKDILEASGGRCVVTGVRLRDVLEAAHIKPVNAQGNDHVSNGFCMRTDIHTLFDTGHLRIEPTGNIHLSDAARREAVYAALPKQIVIPEYVHGNYVDWRWRYM